ncbi:MAG: primosomal protein N' [Candidatus Peribacter sp.]|jgi:primosomal protein N' (replication factor Y) (superfamily II helicase)|nr:primosomal protein N' [Candidatus Peribacter sp.]MBT4392443.1 primosomal protein N' [Candidatus Peribacter sp.]MBT4601227.1 primosomal protein N' [Candidatus Peribacter sp.]MBT5149276.1 primosomal protein N' [Candidatus Peribacter sp.]MBT5637100.1 primosomal protein N' [Candidatus Peribacter sp.]
MLLTVLTAAKSPGISGGLSYEADNDIADGCIVRVPLRNKSVEGVVLGSSKPVGDFDLKKIQESLYDQPLLTQAHIRTVQWVSEYYCCSLRQAMRVFLPSPPWEALLPKKISKYTLLKKEEVRGAKQQSIIEYLSHKDSATWDEIRTELGVSRAAIKPLIEKEILSEIRESEYPPDAPVSEIDITHPVLSDQQKEAYKIINESDKPTLLFGVTGSGKTEVYAQLIADAVKVGKQSILLVPEILLTEANINRFTDLLGKDAVAMLHSRLTPAQKRDEWKRIRFGDVKLVIGSRSALFAPVTNLGLVIIDEEHEWTYKNEQTPRYHARETAEVLCKEFGAKLLLGTATPSLEAWSRTISGRYSLARIDDRYGDAQMPLVKVVDLAQVKFGESYPFSNTVFDAIEERLKKGEQSILFLNRRGVATSMMCLDCRRRVVSPDSNLPFTVHRKGESMYLQDHTTGAIAEVPSVCPGCESVNLRPIGAGTQRVEDIITRKFPNARILRADADTLKSPEQMRLMLKKMLENQADILLGTQSVVKGLDLPNVTLAAVLVADVGMSLPHFRAGERTFQLLTQLTGRSGRKKPGEVIIQTFRPESPEVKLSAMHKTEEFITKELQMRQIAGYPPESNMIRLIYRGIEPKRRAEEHYTLLRSKVEDLAIGCAPTLFGGGKEWHVFIRGANPKSALEHIDLSDTVVDIDPLDCV